MTLTGVRAFLRGRLIELGFQEWTDAFNTENIPESILDRSFHLGVGDIAGASLNMHDQVIDYQNRITLFRRGFQTPAEAVDALIEDSESVICDLLNPDQRIVDKLNVKFEALSIEPLALDNDNSAQAIITFNVQVTLPVT